MQTSTTQASYCRLMRLRAVTPTAAGTLVSKCPPAEDNVACGPACTCSPVMTFVPLPGCANLSATNPICDVRAACAAPRNPANQYRELGSGFVSVGPSCCGMTASAAARWTSDCPATRFAAGPHSMQEERAACSGQCVAPPAPGKLPLLLHLLRSGRRGREPTAGAALAISRLRCQGTGPSASPTPGRLSCALTDADCAAIGNAESLLPTLRTGLCSQLCANDQNCADNPTGPRCLSPSQSPSGGRCGCVGDADCAGNPNGSRCDTDAGSCGCADLTDCAPGEVARRSSALALAVRRTAGATPTAGRASSAPNSRHASRAATTGAAAARRRIRCATATTWKRPTARALPGRSGATSA